MINVSCFELLRKQIMNNISRANGCVMMDGRGARPLGISPPSFTPKAGLEVFGNSLVSLEHSEACVKYQDHFFPDSLLFFFADEGVML